MPRIDLEATVRSMISPDTVEDPELAVLLETAKWAILNKRYPFGVPVGAEVPERYEYLQCQAAVELYTKRGSEGEMSHSENGVTVSYEAGAVSASLLRRVQPYVGSVSSGDA